jgi:hypothetical protein
MTKLEEPWNGFGSNAALFHGTRNLLRACRKFTPFQSPTVAENPVFGQFQALLAINIYTFTENTDYSDT